MPEYRTRNARGDARPLPPFFWTGDTDMACLHRTITDVIDHGYSHHIQRLMVIGNFATLAGLSPQAVADWFLAMYVDSHDWVVTPNVIGMAMNGDGGVMATKPYVSSAAYIDRMSDYCGSCRYDPAQRVGPTACPFNALYWTFLEDHRDAIAGNPRTGAVLRHLDAIPAAERAAMRSRRLDVLNGSIGGKIP
jgi:deoxyribodipyrimidine photolyase-related protein